MRGFYSCNRQLILAVEYFLEIHETLPEVSAPLVQKEKKEKKKVLKSQTNKCVLPTGLVNALLAVPC